MQLLARPRRPEALPQRLDRRRIYVLPTRFGLFVATLLSAMLLTLLVLPTLYYWVHHRREARTG